MAAIPPSYDRFPRTVISADLLRGALVRCGPGVRTVGWPEIPRVRAAALAPWYRSDRVAVRTTAAWIWGATRFPGSPLVFSTIGGRRSGDAASSVCEVHQYVFPAEETRDLDGRLVTSPERTVCDLLMLEERFGIRHRIACRLLFLCGADIRSTVHDRILTERPRYRRRALDRWRGL